MPRQSLSRRQFLKGVCLTVAGAGLTVCGATAAAPDPLPVELKSFTYGKELMNNRILVTYATAAGSTVEVAAAIGETLASHDLAVEVRPVQDEPQIAGYRAVVIGSAVHEGHWLPEALNFVEAHRTALQKVPVMPFCVHIQNLGDDETRRNAREAYLDEVRALIQPAAEGFFAGRFDRRGARLMLPGWIARFVPTLDFRNWKRIHAWAKTRAEEISQ